MYAFFKKLLWHLRYPWLPAWLYGRVRPLRFSVCAEARIPDCVDLFERNGAHGVPAEHCDHYRRALDEGSILTLVAEDATGVVGTFGLQYGFQPNVVWICYVLVRPEQHRRGIGATLLLASLALLPRDHPPMAVAVSALPTALRFYQRMGFSHEGEVPFDNGEMHPMAVLTPVTNAMSLDCRQILHAAGTVLPELPLLIPTPKAPAVETPVEAVGLLSNQ